jgi:methylase of polypeptide subunit release factors
MQTFRPGGDRGITVFYGSEMEGGGSWFGQDYLGVLRDRYPNRRFQNCFEWCSGPGFIGFSLMDHGIVEHLTLADLYAPAIHEAVAKTVNHNQLGQLVNTYVTHTIKTLPNAEIFDLVVANPPHYLECPGDDNYQRIAVDREWAAHRDFYQHIQHHLAEDGVILIQENHAGSLRGVNEFWDMIHDNGLEITGYFTSNRYWDTDGPVQIYYIESRRRKAK